MEDSDYLILETQQNEKRKMIYRKHIPNRKTEKQSPQAPLPLGSKVVLQDKTLRLLPALVF